MVLVFSKECIGFYTNVFFFIKMSENKIRGQNIVCSGQMKCLFCMEMDRYGTN